MIHLTDASKRCLGTLYMTYTCTNCQEALDIAGSPKECQDALVMADASSVFKGALDILVHPLDARIHLTQIMYQQGALELPFK